MKVIDLLNKIANGKEVPLEIKCCNKKYRYDSLFTDYEQIGGFNGLFKDLLILKYGFDLPKCLNDEVEIIEEDKEIEKIDIRNEKNCKNNWKWKVYREEHSYNISTPQKIIADKINEIIDYINKE